MRRLIVATFAIALLVSSSSAFAAPRDVRIPASVFPGRLASARIARDIGVPVSSFPGTFDVRYYVANGPEAHEISASDYAKYVASHSCSARSHLAIFHDDGTVTVVCEL